MSIPPPLPPGQSRSEQMIDAFRSAPPPSAPPPRQGMSGCAIAVIVGGVVLVFGVFIAGMFAAIAIPAYSDYVLRSKVTAAEHHARGVQELIEMHRLDTGECPANREIGFDESTVVELGGDGGQATMRLDSGRCAIELTFANVDPKIDGKTIAFEYDDNEWDCRGGTLPSKYRSPRCRSGNAAYNTPDNTVSP